MEEVHKKILRKNRINLANDLVLVEVLHYLVEAEILSDHLIEKINAEATSFEKNVKFLNLLPKRGPSAFQSFIKALYSTDQKHLAAKLTSDYESITVSNTVQNFCGDNYFSGKSNMHCMNINQGDRIVPPCFSFQSSSVSLEKSKSKQTDFFPKKRVATENEDCSTAYFCGDNNYSTPAKKLYTNSISCDKLDTIPSPNSLDDLISTTSLDDLSAASQLKKSQENVVLNGNARIVQSSDIDLTDGPTYRDVTVRKLSSHQRIDFSDCYTMTSSLGGRGMVLIINVDQFEPSHLDDRQAAEVDRARLELVFRQLGFRCYNLVNGTAQEIWDVLVQFVSLEEHSRSDVCWLVVMSHGEDGCFFGRDGERIIIDNVITLFNNHHCKGLQNKPKVLTFQCCRGSMPDKGVDEIDGGNEAGTVKSPESDLHSSRSSVDSVGSIQNKLPTHCDCLVGYATVKGFAAMRNTRRGSWYIQALVKVLAFHACDKHLVEIMTLVNKLIKSKEGYSPDSEYHRCKEMSIFHSTLCKKLYLFPDSWQS